MPIPLCACAAGERDADGAWVSFTVDDEHADSAGRVAEDSGRGVMSVHTHAIAYLQYLILSNIATVYIAVKAHAPPFFWQRGELELVVAAVDGQDALARVQILGGCEGAVLVKK